jgi:hypothetical protein
MLYTTDSGFVDTDGFTSVAVGDTTYLYRGLFYLRGHRAGAESIKAFAQASLETGRMPFRMAFGAFSCAVVQPDGAATFFTDNSDLDCLYVSSGAISDSFIQLVEREPSPAFDDDALCELLVLGGVFFGRTLVRDIATTEYDRAYQCADGSIRSVDKGIGPFDATSTVEDVQAFFRDMAHALAGHRVTLSLTGGYDSRLVLAGLMEHLPLEVFISGSDETDPDIRWARRAASAAGMNLEIVRVDKPAIDEALVRRLFEEGDGVVAAIDDDGIRISAFMHERRDRGYTCYVTGDGGVRHKDWYWLQDLPFYRRRRTNVAGFYDQRIQIVTTPIPFGRRLQGRSRALRQRMIDGMRRHVKSLNTQSYDAIGFHLQGDLVKVKYATRSRLVPSYAPLWELELVRHSYHLPRRSRFFYNSMRAVITQVSRPLARTPTVYGTTASSEPRYLARDVFYQGIDYATKAARLVGRKFAHRNLFVGHVVTWSAEREIRGLDLASRAVAWAIDEDLMAEGTTIDRLAYRTLGRLVHVYLLAERMGRAFTEPTLSEPEAASRRSSNSANR